MKLGRQEIMNSFIIVPLALVLFIVTGCRRGESGGGNQKEDELPEFISSPAPMPVGEPYSKIKVGMKYSEVFALLGKPSSKMGSGALFLIYNISPTEEFNLQTTGTGDNSIVLKIVYKRSRK